ncbi:MAG: hypothetical protein FWG10_14095 [Eubacteriaceae bacterium]|nr:hypothetical protein [Eubacteriaceae bacterium]
MFEINGNANADTPNPIITSPKFMPPYCVQKLSAVITEYSIAALPNPNEISIMQAKKSTLSLVIISNAAHKIIAEMDTIAAFLPILSEIHDTASLPAALLMPVRATPRTANSSDNPLAAPNDKNTGLRLNHHRLEGGGFRCCGWKPPKAP